MSSQDELQRQESSVAEGLYSDVILLLQERELLPIKPERFATLQGNNADAFEMSCVPQEKRPYLTVCRRWVRRRSQK